MESTYKERLAELKKLTGAPAALEGTVTVDQVYAHYQHEHLEFRHPRGGSAMYLTKPLMDRYQDYLREVAKTMLTDGGMSGMKHAVEDLSDQVELTAPVEFADLRRSGHPQITQGGSTKYDRQPKVHRLTEAELRAKARLRKLPPEILGYIWWHVMHKTEPPPRHSRWEG
jgi:hypothetical protein